MASTTHVAIAPQHAWLGGSEPMKASYGKLMMWIFLLSDTFTFSGLLISYGLVRYSYPAFEGSREAFTFSNTWWPVPEQVFHHVPFLHGVHAPLVFVGIMTFILIFSSVTMVLAVEAGHRGDKNAVEKWMLWTIIGGFAFLGSQAWEWATFIVGDNPTMIKDIVDGVEKLVPVVGANLHANQYGPQDFADFFFFITGFHGTHVFSGVILNIVVFFNATMGIYEKRGHYEMVEKVGLYWHFVDLVWVFVFTFFYLV